MNRSSFYSASRARRDIAANHRATKRALLLDCLEKAVCIACVLSVLFFVLRQTMPEVLESLRALLP